VKKLAYRFIVELLIFIAQLKRFTKRFNLEPRRLEKSIFEAEMLIAELKRLRFIA
jgi:hypothetical protein